MYSLTLECAAGEAEWRAAQLWENGCTGIQEEELPGFRVRLRAFFDVRLDLPGEWAEEPDTDWEAATRAAWPAREIGRTLYLAPDWDPSATPAGRQRVIFHPGMALGTGDHPATRLCMVAIENYVRTGESVLDLGCGSGILGSVAVALGAGVVIGCDIDAASVRVARDHVGYPLFAGSLRGVRPRSVDWIVANVNAETLSGLKDELAKAATLGLILSGFRETELVDFTVAGFSTSDVLAEQGWRCVVLQRTLNLPGR